MTVINGLPAHALLHFLVVLAPLAWHSSAWIGWPPAAAKER